MYEHTYHITLMGGVDLTRISRRRLPISAPREGTLAKWHHGIDREVFSIAKTNLDRFPCSITSYELGIFNPVALVPDAKAA